MRAARRSVAVAVLIGSPFVAAVGCSGEAEQPVPTEAGKQADLKAIQDTAAANDAAGSGKQRAPAARNKGYVPEP